MAHNWLVKEVIKDIVDNGINGNVLDYGKRFQVGTAAVQALVHNVEDKEVLLYFANALPDNLTMNKLNTNLKGNLGDAPEVDETEDDEFDEEIEEEVKTPVKKTPAKTAPKEKTVLPKKGGKFDPATDKYDNNTWAIWDKDRKYTKAELEKGTARPLYNIGRKVYDIPHKELFNKDASINAIMKAQTVAKTSAKPASTKKTVTAKKTDGNGKYDGMKPRDLYGLCIKNKIKVEKQKPAAYYIVKLEEYSTKNALPEDPTALSYDELQEFSAIQLYKMCKKAGIDAEPKMTAEHYISLILPDDEAEDETDFDWDEEDFDLD